MASPSPRSNPTRRKHRPRSSARRTTAVTENTLAETVIDAGKTIEEPTTVTQSLQPGQKNEKSKSLSLTRSIQAGEEKAPDVLAVPNSGSGSRSNELSVDKSGIYDSKMPPGLVKILPAQASNGKELEDEPYFHGYMSREDAEKIVQKDGEFLVRKADVRGHECYVITTKWQGSHSHLKIFAAMSNQVFWIKKYCFRSIPDLIRYHMRVGEAVNDKGVILKTINKREYWQLYHEQVILGSRLGSGEFGEVFSGTLTRGVFTKPVEVAVKTLKGANMTPDDRVTFLREANVMLKIQHKNVVKLYGVCTQRNPMMIVMEIASGGSLLDRVKKPSTVDDKWKWCSGACKGMAYLERQEVIHRDLAARNCLLGKNEEAKISDFGLSMVGKVHRQKKLTKVPVRWLAPETLQTGTFSSKSDVWSFGVVMFEVYSNGAVPYPNIDTHKEVRRRILKENLRPDVPADTPELAAAVMALCFEHDPEKRLTFQHLRYSFKKEKSGMRGAVSNLKQRILAFAQKKGEDSMEKTIEGET